MESVLFSLSPAPATLAQITLISHRDCENLLSGFCSGLITPTPTPNSSPSKHLQLIVIRLCFFLAQNPSVAPPLPSEWHTLQHTSCLFFSGICSPLFHLRAFFTFFPVYIVLFPTLYFLTLVTSSDRFSLIPKSIVILNIMFYLSHTLFPFLCLLQQIVSSTRAENLCFVNPQVPSA